MNAKDRVLDELRRDHNPGLGKFAYCIGNAVELSERYVSRLLNELHREGKARRIPGGGGDVCWQWRPPPKEGPLTAAEALRLSTQAAFRDAEYLYRSAAELSRGNDLRGALRELERAHERYRHYLDLLGEGGDADGGGQ